MSTPHPARNTTNVVNGHPFNEMESATTVTSLAHGDAWLTTPAINSAVPWPST